MVPLEDDLFRIGFGIELDPLPAILARANLAVLGLAGRSKIILSDYRDVDLGKSDGKTRLRD